MDCEAASAYSMTTTVTGGDVAHLKTSPLANRDANSAIPAVTTLPLQQPKVNASAEIDSIANIVIETFTEALRLSIRVDPRLEGTDFVIEGVCNQSINDERPISLPIDVKKLFSLCQNVAVPSQPRFHDYLKRVTEAVSRILSQEASVARAFVVKYDIATKEEACGSLIVKKITTEILSHFDGGAFKNTALESYSYTRNPFARAPGFKAAIKRVLT